MSDLKDGCHSYPLHVGSMIVYVNATPSTRHSTMMIVPNWYMQQSSESSYKHFW